MKQSEISTTILYSWGDEDYIHSNSFSVCGFNLYLGRVIKIKRCEKIDKTHFIFREQI